MRGVTGAFAALAASLLPLLISPVSSAAVALAPIEAADLHQAEIRQVAKSRYFDLSAPSYDLFRNKALQDGTVQQSFAFDNQNRRLFVAQLRNGSPALSGDLAITQLDFSGKKLGHMYLKGFGHGVAFAAQGDGKDTYLWTEVDASKTSGYGQKLTRFKFVNGQTLSASSTSLKKYKPFPQASSITCVINPLDSTLVVRYEMNKAKHIASFSLKSAAKGDFSKPLVNFQQPVMKTKSDTFQGYAAYGQYLYMLTGTSYDSSGGKVNSDITNIDLNTGKVVHGPTLTKAGSTLEYREPEGMGIYTTAAGEPRLFLGFASDKTPGHRLSNIFYKNKLIG